MEPEVQPFEPARERRAPLQSSPLRLRLLVAVLLAMPLGTPLLHTSGIRPLRQPLFLVAAAVWLAVFVAAFLLAPPSSASQRRSRKGG